MWSRFMRQRDLKHGSQPITIPELSIRLEAEEYRSEEKYFEVEVEEDLEEDRA